MCIFPVPNQTLEMSKKTILLVEDEVSSAEMVATFLEMNNFEVIVTHDGNQAIEVLKSRSADVDLALLDIMVPGADGREICRFIRNESQKTQMPVIFLTAKDEEHDEIQGLSIGADDYIPKPASLNLILAHIKSLLRRQGEATGGNQSQEEIVEIAHLSLNTSSAELTVGGAPLELTAREFRLMELFMTNPKRVYSRQEIIDYVFPEEKHVFDRTVDVHIKNIRLKLGDAAALLKTYRGLGYGINRSLL